MKKLGNIRINPEKIIQNDELVTLRGGYEGWTYCFRQGVSCANNPTGDCAEIAVWFCDQYCPGWDTIKCFGG